MAEPTSNPSVTEMNDIFLDGITSPYQLFIADSKLPEAGYGLFARKEIPAGKEIFRAMPVVSAGVSSVDACDTCFSSMNSMDPFKPRVELLTCASCKRVRYCSKGCQRAAWKRYHKNECTMFVFSFLLTNYPGYLYREINTQILKPKEDSLAIRMFIRFVVLHQQGQLTTSQWKAISALQSHMESISQSKELGLPTINADIILVKKVTECDRSESDLQDLYWQINFNQHSVDTPLEPGLGSCLVLSATMINHSCDPNAHHISEGPELVVRSTRKIAKNEEITISYIDSTQSVEERQKILSTTYAFGCQCCKCAKGFKEQGEVLTGNSVLDAPIRNAKSKLHALLDALGDGSQGLDGVETKMGEICNEPSSGKPWPINAPPLPLLYEVLARKFEDEQRWDKALCVWLKILYTIDPLRYPERLNPHRVAHLMALCQLDGRISQMSEIDARVKASFRTIEAALEMVQYYHNLQLKEDAAASLGTNHVIYKIAAHYVEAMDRQMASSRRVPLGVWQKGRFRNMKETFESKETELLKWARIDRSATTL